MRTQPRRVAVIIDSLITGGAERVAVEAAAALDPERYVPHLVVTRHSGPLGEFVRKRGVAHTVLGRERRFDPPAFVRACRVASGADLVHAHKFTGALWGAMISRTVRRPLVAHEHTFDGVGTRGRTLGYRYVISRRAARIVCVSEGVAESLRRERVPARLIEVVPNGVPTHVALPRIAARAELGIDGGATVVGIVGRLRPEKRHELALEALGLLRAQGYDVLLCVVGAGPRGAELRRLAEELGVSDHVIWSGERRDARRLVRAFDVGVLCSSYEGMPLAALEFLVAGVPLVATAVGALPELLDGGAGALVRPGDSTALAEALARALPNGQRGPAGTDRLVERFGLERMVDELQRIYDDVLGGSVGRRRVRSASAPSDRRAGVAGAGEAARRYDSNAPRSGAPSRSLPV